MRLLGLVKKFEIQVGDLINSAMYSGVTIFGDAAEDAGKGFD